jgi:hypothetical protein
MPDFFIGRNDGAQIMLAPRHADDRGLLTRATCGQRLRGVLGSIFGCNR